MKQGVRSIGVDDGPFPRSSRGDVLVAGAIYCGGGTFDGLLTTTIRRDGWNATARITQMIAQSKFFDQLHYLILGGIALGGFNIIDIERVHRETGIKVLVVVRRRPDLAAIRAALDHLSRADKRFSIIERAGEIHVLGKLYCQMKGMGHAEAKELLELTCTRSHLPEPLRAAHLIAGGIIRGQSGRRA